MNKYLLNNLALFFCVSSFAQDKIEWISTTERSSWAKHTGLNISSSGKKQDVEIKLEKPLQEIEGFGTCFNELGWTSLKALSMRDRENIMKELFAPKTGANFTICRMPVGANDFSRDWYSYNESEGDFEMKKFSIANDRQTLIPFIQNALKYNRGLKLWASPWSPPQWMKYNKHYAAALPGTDSKVDNGLRPDQVGKEGTDMFIQKEKYYQAYTLYFSKFIEAYQKEKIKISMVMPQNEFNSAQIFPSCTWTAQGLSKFIQYLGPEMQKKNVQVFFGTMERANEKLADTILKDPICSKYIKGVGFQWGGKGAIAGIYQRYPNLKLYQSEQECGDGKNDWKHCIYSWSLMKHYLSNGASAYLYWNTSLQSGGVSRWGWSQNSLVTVDTTAKTYTYNYEYYLIKHFSHYVQPGAKRLETAGDFTNLLAFINPDKSIVIVAYNESKEDKTISIKVGMNMLSPQFKADSFNTILIK